MTLDESGEHRADPGSDGVEIGAFLRWGEAELLNELDGSGDLACLPPRCSEPPTSTPVTADPPGFDVAGGSDPRFPSPIPVPDPRPRFRYRCRCRYLRFLDCARNDGNRDRHRHRHRFRESVSESVSAGFGPEGPPTVGILQREWGRYLAIPLMRRRNRPRSSMYKSPSLSVGHRRKESSLAAPHSTGSEIELTGTDPRSFILENASRRDRRGHEEARGSADSGGVWSRRWKSRTACRMLLRGGQASQRRSMLTRTSKSITSGR